MTSLTTYRLWTSPTLRNAMVVRQPVAWARHLDAAAIVFRPLVVAVAIITAATTWPAHAHADGLGDAAGNALNGVGIGNNGPVSTALAGIGTALCPMLVKPGATLASMATQLSGHNGIAPGIAGFVATVAIQTQCPGFMTSLANGTIPGPLQALVNSPASSPLPFGLPGANPLQALVGGPASPPPFGLPGANPLPGL